MVGRRLWRGLRVSGLRRGRGIGRRLGAWVGVWELGAFFEKGRYRGSRGLNLRLRRGWWGFWMLRLWYRRRWRGRVRMRRRRMCRRCL